MLGYETWSLAPKEEHGLRAECDFVDLGQCVVWYLRDGCVVTFCT